jgi:hypothetical protein
MINLSIRNNIYVDLINRNISSEKFNVRMYRYKISTFISGTFYITQKIHKNLVLIFNSLYIIYFKVDIYNYYYFKKFYNECKKILSFSGYWHF